MENELVEKSFFNTTGTSVQEFQKKVEKADFWGKVGNEDDKKRLMAPDSQLMKAFMKWSATEAIIMARLLIFSKDESEIFFFNKNALLNKKNIRARLKTILKQAWNIELKAILIL